jgi:hypothetical protein
MKTNGPYAMDVQHRLETDDDRPRYERPERPSVLKGHSMTLVVARTSGHRVAVMSDTQLTEHDVRLPIHKGVVKTYILPGGICVSFSNSPELAVTDFQKFATAYPQGADFASTSSFFEEASAKSGNDYLIAFARQAKLATIVDGQRMPSAAKTQWIGDRAAYERFREYEAKARKGFEAGRAMNAVLFADEIHKSPASDLYSAMRHVIADTHIPTVGGFAYVLSDRIDTFRQSVYCDTLFDWPTAESEDFVLQLIDQIDFGASGENQGFAIAQASPGYLNLNVAAFYWLSGRKVFVFSGYGTSPLMKCSVLNDVEPLQIPARLNVHFGQDLGWLAMVLSAAPSATETRSREPPIATGPSGVRLQLFCHVNTFPGAGGEVRA